MARKSTNFVVALLCAAPLLCFSFTPLVMVNLEGTRNLGSGLVMLTRNLLSGQQFRGGVCLAANTTVNAATLRVLCRTYSGEASGGEYSSGRLLNASAIGLARSVTSIAARLQCTGSEPLLDRCRITWLPRRQKCDPGRMLAVRCLKSSPPPPVAGLDPRAPVRLATPFPLTDPVPLGRVEVNIKGRWESVCADGFTDRSATVVCRQLGYPAGGAPEADPNLLVGFQDFTSAGIRVLASRCTGAEGYLMSCPGVQVLAPPGAAVGRRSTRCPSGKQAVIQCTPRPTTGRS